MSMTRPNVKLIDLGSSCFTHSRAYTYIQSRFYRAPEIILGISYGPAIDVWSLGCVLAELYTGIPLFPGETEADQLACMMEVLGVPPVRVISCATRKYLYFDQHGEPRTKKNSKERARIPGSRSLRNILKGADEAFFQLVEACLKWDTAERIKPQDALRIDWFYDKNPENSRHIVKHKKISLEDITKHVPNLQKFIAHRKQNSVAID